MTNIENRKATESNDSLMPNRPLSQKRGAFPTPKAKVEGAQLWVPKSYQAEPDSRESTKTEGFQ